MNMLGASIREGSLTVACPRSPIRFPLFMQGILDNPPGYGPIIAPQPMEVNPPCQGNYSQTVHFTCLWSQYDNKTNA